MTTAALANRLQPESETTSILPRSVRGELLAILEKLEQHEKDAHRARVLGDLQSAEAAEDLRRDAEGQVWAAESQLAELFLLLLRKALEYWPIELRIHLESVIRDALLPELKEIADAVARLEERL